MFAADSTEIAWLTQHRTATRMIAVAAIVLFAGYGMVDWYLAPELLRYTVLWRIGATIPCLAVYFLLTRDHWLPRIPLLMAVSCMMITAVVSVIFLGLLEAPSIALAGQMQVLVTISMFSTMRSSVRATLVAMWASYNLGLWWIGEPAASFFIHNLYLLGGSFVTLVISEVSYRNFKSRRALEVVVQQQADIVQSSDDAMVARSPNGVVTSWNPGAHRLFGYSAEERVGHTLAALFVPERSVQEQENLQRVLQGNSVLQFETERLCKSGVRRELSVTASPIRDVSGRVVGVSEIARDVTDKNQTERVLRDKDARFRAAIETSPDGFLTLDMQGRIVDVNAASCSLSGYSRAELLASSVTDLDALPDTTATARRIEEVMQAGNMHFETVHRRKDGSTWPVEVVTTYSPVMGGQFYVFLRDLTERKLAEAATWRQANFDHLTGLPNRALFFDRLNQDCMQAGRNQASVALLFADLDGFKQVNDTHGHQAGDLVLKEVANRWLATVRESDTVARLGGDEFAIVISGVKDRADVSALAEKLLAALHQSIGLEGGTKCNIGASIGIALFPADADNVDQLILCADKAMYASKRASKNAFSFAQPGIQGG